MKRAAPLSIIGIGFAFVVAIAACSSPGTLSGSAGSNGTGTGTAGGSKNQYLGLRARGAIVREMIHGCLLEYRVASKGAVPRFWFR